MEEVYNYFWDKYLNDWVKICDFFDDNFTEHGSKPVYLKISQKTITTIQHDFDYGI